MMSEVHRYNVVNMLSEAGNRIGYDPHGPLVVMASEFDRVTAERDALQLRLNAADQMIAEQRVALMRIHDRAEAFAEDERSMQVASVEVIRDIAARALGDLPTTEEPATEYGPTPGCRQCEEAEACGFTDCPECDAQLHEDVNGTGFQPGRDPT